MAEALEDRVAHLALIESDRTKAEEAAGRLRNTVVLNGSGTDLGVLEEAAIDKCDLFCAMSDDGNSNVLSSLLAKKHGAQHTAVLVYEKEYASVLDMLGVDMVINPRLVVVGEILQHVRRGHVFSVTRLAEGEGEIIELEALEGSAVVGPPLKKIKFPKNALVGAIVSNGNMTIPSGETQIRGCDRVLVYALPSAIPRIENLFSRKK